jgi:hypothetical protein
MTRDELTHRILELFPQLAEIEPWDWAETEDDQPVVMIEKHATFTGMEDGAVDLTLRSRTRRWSASGGSSRAATTSSRA